MGTRVARRGKRLVEWEVLPGEGEVAQVAHPCGLDTTWSARDAVDACSRIAQEVGEDVKLLLTGGGFITLDYPGPVPGKRILRTPEFLRELHAYTLGLLRDSAGGGGIAGCDLVLGVDVRVGEYPAGQFAWYVGSSSDSLVPKRFPVGVEAEFLAGVDASTDVDYNRIVSSQVGNALLLVCHDAQAYNRRNRANVRRAKTDTPRMRAIGDLDAARGSKDLQWALDVIHWIDTPANAQTFHISLDQIRVDFPGEIRAAGSFGYGQELSREDIIQTLDKLVSPRGMRLPKVILRSA